LVKIIKKIITICILIILFTSCLTSAGERNAFELKARTLQIAMKTFMRNNRHMLKNPDSRFIKNDNWFLCLESNKISYKLEFGIKTPLETLADGYADFVNLSFLSIWNYGYENITGWCIMQEYGSYTMHVVIIYDGNMIVSSRSRYRANTVEEFKNEFPDYYFFNFYTSELNKEVSQSDVYEYNILRGDI
jgi:hypothetical protein